MKSVVEPVVNWITGEDFDEDESAYYYLTRVIVQVIMALGLYRLSKVDNYHEFTNLAKVTVAAITFSVISAVVI